MKRNIDAQQSPDIYHLTDQSPVLEIYANQDFDTSAGERVLAGDPSLQNFYRSITCSVVDGQLVVPAIVDIDTTEDSPDNQQATYSAYLRADGQQLIDYLLTFRIPPSTTTPVSSISWITLRIHKSGIIQRDPLTTYTKAEILALIETEVQIAIGTLNDASSIVKGRTLLSVDPALANTPKAFGVNDTHLPTVTTPIYYASQFASVNAAITAIGSAVATLIISAAQSPITTVSIPATLTLAFEGAGSLLLTTGQTITILSDASQWPVRKVFYNATAGLGTVSFSGNKSLSTLHPEWWGAIGDGGTTDNFSAFQATLTAAATLPITASARVLLSSPNYYLVNISASTTLTVASSVTIEGVTGSTKIRVGPEASVPAGVYILFTVSNGVNFKVKNLTLTGPTNSGGHDFRSCLHLTSTGSVTYEYVTVTNFDTIIKTDAALTLGGITVDVDHCNFTGAANNSGFNTILIGDLQTVRIRHSVLSNPSSAPAPNNGYILYLGWSSNLDWDDNDATGAPAGFAIHPEGGTASAPDFWQVTNSRFTGTYGSAAVLTNLYKDSLISNNTFTGMTKAISVRFDAQIVNNSFKSTKIIQQGNDTGPSVLVANNNFLDSSISTSYGGAVVTSRWKLLNNQFNNPATGYCVYAETEAAIWYLERNIFRGGTTAQVSLSFGEMHLDGNYFHNTIGVPAWQSINVGLSLYGSENWFNSPADAFLLALTPTIFNVNPRRAERPTTIASAGNLTLDWNYDTYRVTGATNLNNVNLPIGGAAGDFYSGGIVRLIPAAGATWGLTSSGNILANAGARAVNREVVLQNLSATLKWVEAVPLLAASDLSNGVSGSGSVLLQTSPSLTTPNINVATGTSLALGGGTAITKIVAYASSLTPASVAANTSAEQDFTVSGLTTADKVIVNGPAPTAGTGIVAVRVKSADTLSITFGNFTAGALTPVSGTYNIIAVRN